MIGAGGLSPRSCIRVGRSRRLLAGVWLQIWARSTVQQVRCARGVYHCIRHWAVQCDVVSAVRHLGVQCDLGPVMITRLM